MKKGIIIILFAGLCNLTQAPETSLPLSVYNSADTIKSLIFYISGDGGFNKFSTSLMQALKKQGHAVIGLDAKDYFWHKKNPQDAANAIEADINEMNSKWKRQNIVLIGYSFGADVAPFMLTHFSSGLTRKVNHLILISPSSQTDFEIHVLQMLGWGSDSGESVPAEINRISIPVTIISGDDENEFPFNDLTIKNKRLIKMPGDHHFDGNVDALCTKILSAAK